MKMSYRRNTNAVGEGGGVGGEDAQESRVPIHTSRASREHSDAFSTNSRTPSRSSNCT